MNQTSSSRRDFPLSCRRKISYFHSVDVNQSQLTSICAQFLPTYGEVHATVLSGGIINQTYLVEASSEASEAQESPPPSFILQKLNSTVFKDPEKVTRNIQIVADHFQRQHPSETYLKVIPSVDGELGVSTADGHFWRAFEQVPDAVCFEEVNDSALAYETGKGFGRFFRQLEGIDTSKVFDSIPNFHHTPKRFSAFQNALAQNSHQRAELAAEEIHFLLNHTPSLDRVTLGMSTGEIPIRLCHNDTKISNILFDKASRKAKCVIDLDTIMTGSLLYDFGDLVRTSLGSETPSSPSSSPARSLSSSEKPPPLDLEIFHALAKGFLEETNSILTSKERELLVYSSQLITSELALRFLTDFLEGDQYFSVDSPTQNLERTRTQIQLLRSLQVHETEMNHVISELSN